MLKSFLPVTEGFVCQRACNNNACASHKGDSRKNLHKLVSVNLIVDSSDYRTCVVRCLWCSHEMRVPMWFDATTGVEHGAVR